MIEKTQIQKILELKPKQRREIIVNYVEQQDKAHGIDSDRNDYRLPSRKKQMAAIYFILNPASLSW